MSHNVTRTGCNEKLKIFYVFILFRIWNTRRFAQTVRRACYTRRLCLYMLSHYQLENVPATFESIRSVCQKFRWRSQMRRGKNLSRPFKMDKISWGPRSYHKKSVYCLDSCRLHRSDWKTVKQRYDTTAIYLVSNFRNYREAWKKKI